MYTPAVYKIKQSKVKLTRAGGKVVFFFTARATVLLMYPELFSARNLKTYGKGIKT